MVDVIFDIETTGLDPSENGKVLCISCLNVSTNELKTFFDLDEKLLLSDFWDYIRSLNNPRLFTFNGDSFDIPYIIHRSLVREVRVEKYLHIDLRKTVNSFFSSYDKKVKGNLAYWATVLGIQQKTLDGSHMISLFLDKRYDEIVEHCAEDVAVAHQLYLRCKTCGLLNGN
jgi:uncharacterized protein YprB with RNaseH-like and TPR domain